MPLKVMQNRNLHNHLHTEVTTPRVGTQNTHHLLTDTLRGPEHQSAKWTYTHTGKTHTHMLSTPATCTPVSKCNPETALPQTPGTPTHTHTHMLKQLMCKKYETLPGNTPFSQTHKHTENTRISSQITPKNSKDVEKKNADTQHTPGIQLTVYTDLPSHTHQDTEHREHTDLYSRLNKRNSSHQHMALNTCWGHAHVENAH